MLRSAEPPQPEPAPRATPDAALDAVAAILRALAASAPPTVGRQLEAWARHILVLAPPPGAGEEARSSRDWPALRRAVVALIRDEHDATTRSIGELQDVVWTVIEGLSRAIVADSEADATANEELTRLRVATAGSPEQLRSVALETVERVSRIIDDKRSRQRELAHELGSRMDMLRHQLEHTKRGAETDALTDLGNRAVIERELTRAVQLHALVAEPACLIMVDVDGFKGVNDRHGHPVGDEVLRAIARALVMSFPRRSDVVTRYGGDEFAVILRDATALDGERLGGRLLASVRSIDVAGPRGPVSVTVSVGVAETRAGESPEAWLRRADEALYAAKGAGRDRVLLAA